MKFIVIIYYFLERTVSKILSLSKLGLFDQKLTVKGRFSKFWFH